MTQLRSKILRTRFLTQTALTGISVLALMLTLTPSQAQAACAETDAGKNWDCNGVIAASQAETFTVDQFHGVLQGGTINPALITGNGGNAVGITVTGDINGTIDLQDGSVITHATGAGTRNGLVVTSAGTTSANPIIINADGTINVTDPQGSAMILNGATTTTFDVNLGDTANITGAAGGIIVTEAGIVTLDVAGDATVTATAGDAIRTVSTSATANTAVTVNGTLTATGGYGVDSQIWGDGGTATIVTGSDSSVTSTGGAFAGLYASGSDLDNDEVAGSTSVTTGSNSTLIADGDSSAGIYTDIYGDAATATVLTGTESTITVTDDGGGDVSGIYARARDDNGGGSATGNGTSGAVSVTTGTDSTITVTGDNSSGITTQNDGDGNSTIVTGEGSSIDVTGDTSFGIASTATLGNSGTGNVDITLGQDSSIAVHANGGAGALTISAGIYAATVDGTVTIGTDGGTSIDVDTNGTNPSIGVYASSTNGAVDVTVDDVTSHDGNGIVTSAGASSSIDVNGAVSGLGTSTGTATIDMTTAATFTTTLTTNADGSITNTGDTAGNLSVRGQGNGSIVFHNDGDLTGRVNFSAMGGAGTVTMTNTSNTWTVSGTNTFTANADSLVNSGASNATIQASGATVFDFGAGADTFTNGTGASNEGIISMSGNSLATDTFTLTSVAYTGSASSGTGMLVVDAHLGGTGGTADTSDKLIISGSSTTAGTTYVRVNNLNTASQASLNDTGIIVVQGSTAADQFVLDPTQTHYNSSKNALDEGMFDYSLTHSGGNDLLVSTPSDEPLELAALVGAAQEIWQSTSPWQDRQADMRDSMATHSHEVSPGVWAKGLGRWSSRDVSQTATTAGVTTTNTADYDQKTFGGVGGIDGSKELSGGGRIIVGGQGGYVKSDVDFSSNSAEITGAVAGAYVTFLKNGFFADGAFKANFLNMDYTAPTLGGSANTDVRSYGGEFDAGQRFTLNTLGVNGVGKDAFIEPVVSLAYVLTSIDDFTIAGTTVGFDDNQSLRAGGGLRAGATIADTNAMKARFAVTGRVWNEFLGDNKVTLHQAGPDTTVTDTFDGVFGEGGVSLNLFGKGANAGLSGFVNGSVKVGQDYLSPGVTAGARFEW